MNDPSSTRTPGDDPQARLQESKERAVDAAQGAALKVQNVAEDRIAEARDAVQARVADVRDTAQAKISEVRGTAEERAEQGVSTAASGLKDTAHRLRDVAGDMDEKDRWLGATLEQAAKVAERGGDYLSGQDLGNVVDDAQRLARRNPAAFMGGAAALGFALARLGKVTVDRATSASGTSSFDTTPTHGFGDGNRMTASAPGRTTPGAIDGRDLKPGMATPLHRSQT